MSFAGLCRGGLFLLTYLLFPVNVLVGVLLGIWRLVITALFNIVHLGRMDISLLNRNVEDFDTGTSDYIMSLAQLKTSSPSFSVLFSFACFWSYKSDMYRQLTN